MSHALRVSVPDQIAFFRAFEDDGTAKTNLVFNEAGIAITVFRVGAVEISGITLSAKVADNSPHSNGAIRQVSGNLYTLDLPDSVTTTQVPSISVKGSYTGGVIEGVPHPVIAYDPTDNTVLGLSAVSQFDPDNDPVTVGSMNPGIIDFDTIANLGITDTHFSPAFFTAIITALKADPEWSDLTVIATQLDSTETIVSGHSTLLQVSLTSISLVQDDLEDGGRIDLLIDSLITDMDTLTTTSEKLDDTLEDNAGTYRFTAAALNEAPSSGGGLTDQQLRDAMKLAPSAGPPSAGSIDEVLSNTSTFDPSSTGVTIIADGIVSASFATNSITSSAITNGSLTDIKFQTNPATTLTRVTAIETILSGITSLASWLRSFVRKDTANATALTEINISGGAYSESNDSQEAHRDYTENVAVSKLDMVINFVDDLENRIPVNMASTLNFLDVAVSTRLPTIGYIDHTIDINAIKVNTDQMSYTANGLDVNLIAIGGTTLSNNVPSGFDYFFDVVTPTKTIEDVGVAGAALTPQAIWEYSTRGLTEEVETDTPSRIASQTDISSLLTSVAYAASLPVNFEDLDVSAQGTMGLDLTQILGASTVGEVLTNLIISNTILDDLTDLVASVYVFTSDSLTNTPTNDVVVLSSQFPEIETGPYFEITQSDDYSVGSEAGPIGPIIVITEIDLTEAVSIRFGATRNTGTDRFKDNIAFEGTATATPTGTLNEYNVVIEITNEELVVEHGLYGWDVEALFPGSRVRTFLNGTCTVLKSMGNHDA